MGQLSLILADMAGTPIPQPWAIEEILSATVMEDESDRFSPHSILVSGSFRQTLALLGDDAATVLLYDDALGYVAWAYLDNPEEQITAEDAHTISLSLPNVTEQLRLSTTGQGWVAGGIQSPVSRATIVSRLGSLRAGWQARWIGSGGDAPYIVRYEDPPILGALSEFAVANFANVRQGRNPDGSPARIIEIGNFDAPATVELISADGGNADDIMANPTVRLVRSITRRPADRSKLTNIVTPLGAGEGMQQVRLRRLFRMLYDPTYEHYGQQATLFPEYDPRYPIPALQDSSGKWRPARLKKGDSRQWEIAARLDGGADGYEYCVVNLDSLNYWNGKFPGEAEFKSQFSSPQFTYVDSNVNNQEYSERALYVAAKAHLAWYGMPIKSLSVEVIGTARPPRVGTWVNLNVRRVGSDERGDFDEMEETGTYKLVSVQATYANGARIERWELSENGRRPPDAADRAVDATRKLIEAYRSIPDTQASIYPLDSGIREVDSLHPLTKYWEIPATAYRVQQAKIRINLFPARHTVSATDAPSLRVDVPIPSLAVNTFAMSTTATVFGVTDIQHGQGFSKGGHSHRIRATDIFFNANDEFNTHLHKDRKVVSTPGGSTANMLYDVFINSFTGLNHTHGEDAASDVYSVLPTVDNYVGAARNLANGSAPVSKTFTGVTTASSTTGTSVVHGHTLLPGIFETTLPMRVQLWLDNGDGTLVDVSPQLGGPWTQSMSTSVDFTSLVEHSVGRTVRLQVVPVNVTGNPTGLGAVELTGFGIVELSGVGSTIYAI